MASASSPVFSPVRIGCAGWALASRFAAQFPTQGSHLERYAQVMSCVEINSSFYRSHQAKTYARWATSVPGTFRFSVKMPRTITHERRLAECEVPLRAFLDEIAPLGEKLGCLLIQLPPSLSLDAEQARRFFARLRTHTTVSVACEPRHASWFTPQGAAVLSEASIACVRAHPSPIDDVEPVGDPALLYIRLHGAPEIYYSAYDDVFIGAVADRIRAAQAQGRVVWCIFDNTARGEATPNALALMAMLDQARSR